MPIRVTSKHKAPVTKTSQPPVSGLPFGLPPPPADRPQKPPGISLCMIVKNEERFLAQCLRSAADVVDEIIVVDTGSTDRTIEIAKSFGATVLDRPWRNDFAWARNQSIEPATKRWILFLDADEELEPASKPALLELKNAPAYHHAVWVRCFNESDDYRGTGAMSHSLIRVFPNAEEIRFRGLIHEFPTVNNSPNGMLAVNAPISIRHHGYLKDVVTERNKAERNFEMVKAAAAAEPDDPFHHFNVGSTAFLMGRYEEARVALEEMRRINGTAQRGFIPNALSVLAEIYCDKLGDPVKGEEICRVCLQASPHYANAHFQLGKALVAQGRFDEARRAYEMAIDDGKYAHLQFVVDDQVYVWKAHSEIGSSYVLQGNDEKAIEWFRKGLKNAPDVQPLRANLARALERSGRKEEAEAIYRQLYRDFQDASSTADFVNCLLRRDRGLDALEIIKESYEKLNDESAAALLLGAAQIAQKHQLPWLGYLELAATRAPGSADILIPLEAAYKERGDEAAIARLLDHEAKTQPVAPADFLRRSFQAIGRQDFAQALELASAGVALAPDDGRLRYNAALALCHLGEKEQALEHLVHIGTQHDEVYAPAELLRAATERELGRADDAMASVSRLLAVDAENAEAIALRAALFEQRGDFAAAESGLQRLFAVHRQRGGVELASFYLRQERFADAARVAEAALKP